MSTFPQIVRISAYDTRSVAALMLRYGRRAQRAMARAMNTTCREVMKAEKQEMQRTFKNLRPWTLRALAYQPAETDYLQAEVYLNRPIRMSEHYLTPEVEGTVRALKGFERAIGLDHLVPTKYMPRDSTGAVSMGVMRQILSVLRRAESHAGYAANITARSRRRNTKERDFVLIREGNHIPPGIYRRTVKPGYGRSDLATRPQGYDLSRAWQGGRRRPTNDIRARGLAPYLLKGKGAPYRQIFDFYGVARRVVAANLEPEFRKILNRYLREDGLAP